MTIVSSDSYLTIMVFAFVFPIRSFRKQCEPVGDRHRHPIGANAQVTQNDLSRVVSRKPGDVASRMAARSAEIQARQMSPIAAGAEEGTVVADLAVGEGADQEVALAHVGQRTLGVDRRARE